MKHPPKKNNTIDSLIHLSQSPHAEKQELPTHFKPELCFSTKKVPNTDDWLHEIKFDGYRMIAILNKGKVTLLTRRGQDWTRKFAKIAKALSELKLENAILDGELVALDEQGRSHFQLLQNALKLYSTESLKYYLFDLPYCRNYNLRKVPLIERKKILKNLLSSIPQGEEESILRYSDHVLGNGNAVFQKACSMQLEGIISKRTESDYEQCRSKNWLKSKCIERQEFVIGGFTQPKGTRQGFGSLLVGLFNEEDRLIYHGHVGTGFDKQTLASLYKKLMQRQQAVSPFQDLKGIRVPKNITWVKPDLVAELEFTEWTADKLLRHPAFLGLRLDKPAREVTAEKILENEKKAPLREEILEKNQDKTKKSIENTLRKKYEAQNYIAGLNISHPNNIIDPQSKVTKLELAQYYQKIAPLILPHIINRPLSLFRLSSTHRVKGSQSRKYFFQKHYLPFLSSSIYPIDIKTIESKKQNIATAEKAEKYIMIKDLQGLIALIQFNSLEIHPWGSSKDYLEKPDRMIFDLDPGPKVAWANVIQTAFIIRTALQQQGLKAYVKTSGGKGLHLVVPLLPKHTWSQVKSFAKYFSEGLVERYPILLTTALNKSKREDKIFVDYLRNTRGATTVGVYSTRAKDGLPISTPLTWSELKNIPSARCFTISNIFERIQKLKKDPWAGFFQCEQNLVMEP